jgi:hypothetical protein
MYNSDVHQPRGTSADQGCHKRLPDPNPSPVIHDGGTMGLFACLFPFESVQIADRIKLRYFHPIELKALQTGEKTLFSNLVNADQQGPPI